MVAAGDPATLDVHIATDSTQPQYLDLVSKDSPIRIEHRRERQYTIDSIADQYRELCPVSRALLLPEGQQCPSTLGRRRFSAAVH